MGNAKVILNGSTLIDLTSDSVSAVSLLSGITAHNSAGNLVTGSIATKSAADIGISGPTVSIVSGYYSTNIDKTISVVTAGTPTATKGSVSNHSISVTPSVSNPTGYINGGSKTGAAVTISVSELVSGTTIITANATNINVTNYATASVNVQPALQSKSGIIPTESAQTITADSTYYGLSSVGIAAISSNYVGSAIPRRTASNLSVNNNIVTVPSGYYATSASASISSGSVAATAFVSLTPSFAVDNNGVVTVSQNTITTTQPALISGYIDTVSPFTVTVAGSSSFQLPVITTAEIDQIVNS